MTVLLDCYCGNTVLAEQGVSGKRRCYRCRRVAEVHFSVDGTYGVNWLPNSVQSCITAIGFPDNMQGLVRMADWHQEHDSRYVTDLESLLYESEIGFGKGEVGYW